MKRILTLAIAAGVAMGAQADTYVLVHGALLGSWTWSRVVGRLQAKGHNAVTLDVPGRDADGLDPHAITLFTAADKVCQVARLQKEKVVLVGHSQGGMVISQAAENCPETVKSLAYVCALLPQDGDAMFGLISDDADALIGPALEPDAAAGTVRFKPTASFKDVFCNDCNDEDVRRATAMLTPEPLGIGATPAALTAKRFGAFPKTYIECTEDRTISLGKQRQMHGKHPGVQVHTLQSSHSPFVSRPDALVELLTR